jgi:hypothetical protein
LSEKSGFEKNRDCRKVEMKFSIFPDMNRLDKKIFWLSTVIEKYAKSKNKSRVQAFQEISASGSFDFIEKHYNVEHLLSFEDVIEDIDGINAKMAT